MKQIEELRIELATVENKKFFYEEKKAELSALHDNMNTITSKIALETSNRTSMVNREKELVDDHKRQLEILMHYSVLNDAFSVWYEDKVITLNGNKIASTGNQVSSSRFSSRSSP